MGVVRSAHGSDRFPQSARTCSEPRNQRRHITRAAGPNAFVSDSKTGQMTSHVKSKPRLASKGSLNTNKPSLRKLAPNLTGSRDFQKGMRPPTALAATHPAACDGAYDGANTKAHVHSSPMKPAHVKMDYLAPSQGLGALPSTPLFSTTPIKKEPGLEQSPSSHQTHTGAPSVPGRSEPYIYSIPADPTHQISVRPPNWQGKAGVLGSDTNPDNCGLVSPVCMTGLPFGGMIEMANFYGPPSARGPVKREQ